MDGSRSGTFLAGKRTQPTGGGCLSSTQALPVFRTAATGYGHRTSTHDVTPS